MTVRHELKRIDRLEKVLGQIEDKAREDLGATEAVRRLEHIRRVARQAQEHAPMDCELDKLLAELGWESLE